MGGWVWMGMDESECHAVQLSCPPTPHSSSGSRRCRPYLPISPLSPYISLILPVPQARGAAGRPEAEALGGPGRTLRDTELLGQPAPLGRSSRLRRWGVGRETPTRSLLDLPLRGPGSTTLPLERLTMRLVETALARTLHTSPSPLSSFLDALLKKYIDSYIFLFV